MQERTAHRSPWPGAIKAIVLGALIPVLFGLGIGVCKAAAPNTPPYTNVITYLSYGYRGASQKFTVRLASVLPERVDDYVKSQVRPDQVVAICSPVEIEPGVYIASDREGNCRTIPVDP